MLTIVTWNKGKYEEICKFLPDSIDPVQADLDVPEIQTNILADISYDKCLQAWVEIQWPVLVDDSGIYFDAYHEFPWALTKYLYTWIWLEWMAKLFVWENNKKATFQSVVSYMDAELSEPVQFVWEVEGTLNFDYLWQEKEDPRLPYDLIFVPDGMQKPSFFDMGTRNSEYSHRIRAVKKFGEWMSIR